MASLSASRPRPSAFARLVPLAPFALAGFALVAGACSSSTYEGPPASEAGAGEDDDDDGGGAHDGSPIGPGADGSGFVDGDLDAPRATACTAPPFVGFAAHVHEILAGGADRALAGATVQFTSCPGFVLTTDDNGAASTQVTQSVPYSPFFYAPAHVAVIGPESPAASDADLTIALPHVDATEIIPGYDVTKPSLEILLVAKGTAAPCDAVSGVTIAVTNHPEGTPKYMSAGWPADKNPTGAASSVGPAVFVTGLATGLVVEVSGAKAGCKVTTITSAQTGRFHLTNAELTIGTAVITNN